MVAWLRRYPFISYGTGALGIALIVAVPATLFELQYDDGWLGGAVFLLSLVWRVLAFPFALTHEWIQRFGLSTGVELVVSVGMGLACFIIAEVIWHLWLKRRA